MSKAVNFSFVTQILLLFACLPLNKEYQGDNCCIEPPAFGQPRDEETAHFLGCGWSLWLSGEYSCKNPATDDLTANFTITYDDDIEKVTMMTWLK